ncbi:MAG: EamA family transporter [Acidimicrobiales bacterium]|nr:EamA family transporter [Acidimicrobiales bacterium]
MAGVRMLWLVATLIAAVFQTVRTAMQQHLRDALSPNAAGFVRYSFGAPIALAAVAVLWRTGTPLPSLSPGFLWRVALGGFSQIVGTEMLIRSFRLRDFAIGTTYAKTETAQVAALSAVALGEPLAGPAWFGVAICFAGVAVLACRGSLSRLGEVLRAKGDRAMWTGLAAGAGFATAAVYIRAASSTLGTDHPIARALVTLAVMNTLQATANSAWLAWREPGAFRAIGRVWRSSATVGVLSVGGSAGFAIAMTLHNAAVVRTVGQVDLVLAFLAGRFVFREVRLMSEYVGSLLVVLGVVAVVVAS